MINRSLWRCLFRSFGVCLFIVVGAQAKKSEKMALYCGVLASDFANNLVVSCLVDDVESSGQFAVHQEISTMPKAKKELRMLSDKGWQLALFVSFSGEEATWWLYATAESEVIASGSVRREGTDSDWGHMLAHAIWKGLMGAEGPFASRIAYVKKNGSVRHRYLSGLCIADWSGMAEEALLVTPRISVAPYWGPETLDPYLYISEFTPHNVRLKKIDLAGRQRVILDFDGTTVGVSFQQGTGSVAYGHSGGIWCYVYDPVVRKGRHVLVIKEHEVCASPTLFPSGDIVYCSGGKIKYYHAATGNREVLVGDGYCVAPACHISSKKIVYSRRIKGGMQLCLYDLHTRNEKQLTDDEGDKIDACWSPCGTWVCYCKERRGKGQLFRLHISTKKRVAITDPEDNCRFPAWSPVYEHLPHVTLRGRVSRQKGSFVVE